MYSKQDLEKLNGNLKKIEEFCRQNYIPRIPRREDRICVDFGPLESYPRQWGREPKYSFGMDGRGNIWFRVGGLVLPFGEDKQPNIFKNNVYGEDLLLNWKKVKGLIEAELDILTEKKRILDEFEV